MKSRSGRASTGPFARNGNGKFARVQQRRQKYDAAPGDLSLFDLLPDELVMAVLRAAPDGATVEAWSLASRRHYALAADPALWRHLYESHWGPLLHAHFQSWRKDWRWVYCARSRNGRTGRTRVGEVDVLLNGKRGTYWGDLAHGKPHGYGTMFIPSFDGADNRIERAQATGSSLSPGLDCYEGDWVDGVICGYGIYVWANGVRYEGKYKDNNSDGYGVQTWPNGARYAGERRNGLRHGHGVQTWPCGDRYVGEWVDGKMHGHGVFQGAHGLCYDGQRDQNDISGRGAMTYPDGLKYDGEWLGNRRHGDGVCTYPDGSTVHGEWSHGAVLSIAVVTHRSQGPPCGGGADPASLCEGCADVQFLR
ncbi:Morn repeat domain containing protein [Pandoravirus dulcis]|uniref:Morn repeat domain containing protein n=1 Tax=Pandoravirus dulcis TaxID=1349409 RepID=S4VX76_9VIRU|nr:Morn repeat domain containing protein [Pandoravirus dulcis]AGO82686.1 Morn repeat domain containing protein [Pandoravirus dulcis]